MRARRPAAAVLAAMAAMVAAPPAAGAPAPADPAVAALRQGDVFVSSRALGPASAAARDRLAATARALRDRGHDAKIAIVAGPSGAPSMRAYTRRLRLALAFTGTLTVTAPGRPVVAIGPRPPADITRDLRAERVGLVDDPVDRVVRAAELAVGERRGDGAGSGTRGLTALLALAVIGGAWAAAWGLRREIRRASTELSAERARVRVELDALRARTRDLATRPDPPAAARDALDRAVGHYSEALVQLERSRRPEEVRRAILPLSDGLAALERAAAELGEPLDPGRLYDGLCAIDPGHGPATTTVTPLGSGAPVPACERCSSEAAAGRVPARRVVPVDGRDVPFDEAPTVRDLVGAPEA